MADFPGNISPYPVAGPARGDFTDLVGFIRQRFLTDQAMQQDQIAENTRQAINQQQGFGNIDPFAQQKYDTQGLENTINQGDYGMRQTNFQNTQDFAKNFIGAAQDNPTFANDPYAQLFIQGGANPLAAQGLAGHVGDQSQRANREKELQMQLENSRKVAEMTNQSKLQAMKDEFGLRTNLDKQQKDSMVGAVQKYLQTGDVAGAIAEGVPTEQLMLLGEQRQQKTETDRIAAEQEKLKADAEKSKNRLMGGNTTGKPSDNYTPEQKQQIALSGWQRAIQVPTNDIEEFTRVAAEMTLRNPQLVEKGRAAFGSNFDDIYNQLLRQKQQAEQNQAFQGDVEKASNPIKHYIKKFLDSALPQ